MQLLEHSKFSCDYFCKIWMNVYFILEYVYYFTLYNSTYKIQIVDKIYIVEY